MVDPEHQQQQENNGQNQGSHQQLQQHGSSQQQITYSAERVIGNGSFGVVYQAKILETGMFSH